MRRCSFVLALLLCLCGACGQDQMGPVETLRVFLRLMDESATDEESLREAYELLNDGAHKSLGARAHKAQTLSGRTYEPWEMLAQGRFRLLYAPAASGGMRVKIDGDTAVVLVRDSGGTLRARVPMVRESGSWRVSLAIPPMSGASTQGPAAAP